jgi:murein DD-endopeptidase MepM/ murein hydrolase activator NlpD
MRPVSLEFEINQPFGGMRTAGVAPSSTPDTVGWYVRLYGNYQPYGHAGCDIACPEGTPVHAIAAGTVLWADWGTKLPGDESDWGYRQRWYLYKSFPGIVTVIQHKGWIGVYAHLSAATLNPGDTVREGQQIGLSGGTGGVAPHLHVEALIDLNYTTGGGLIYGRTDPTKYFGSAALAPQGTNVKPIKGFLMALTDAQQKLIYDRLEKYVDAPISAVPDKTWEVTVVHGGTHSVKTELVLARKEAAALRSVIGVLAKNPNLTADQITEAVKAGLAESVVDVNVSVNGGK